MCRPAELCLQPTLRGKQAKLVEPGGHRLRARLLVEVRGAADGYGGRDATRLLASASLAGQHAWAARGARAGGAARRRPGRGGGVRPGGLAPRESDTRFTWTLANV